MLCNQMQCERLLCEWVKREKIADKLHVSFNRFHPPSIDENSITIDDNASGGEESGGRIYISNGEAAGHLQELLHLDL